MPIAGSWETVSRIHLEIYEISRKRIFGFKQFFMCKQYSSSKFRRIRRKMVFQPDIKSYSQGTPNWNGGLKSVSIDEENSKLAFSLPFEIEKLCDFYIFGSSHFF